MRAEREHPILKDETQFGTDWCIVITQELIAMQSVIFVLRERGGYYCDGLRPRAGVTGQPPLKTERLLSADL
jgi:hypothetical protein